MLCEAGDINGAEIVEGGFEDGEERLVRDRWGEGDEEEVDEPVARGLKGSIAGDGASEAEELGEDVGEGEIDGSVSYAWVKGLEG